MAKEKRDKVFLGKFLVGDEDLSFSGKYCTIDNPLNYSGGCGCIITKNLNPDYYLLFGKIKLIISENGSSLSHLAIVARENNISLIIVKDIISKIKTKGRIKIEGGRIYVS